MAARQQPNLQQYKTQGKYVFAELRWNPAQSVICE